MYPHIKVVVSPPRQRTQHGGQGGNVHWTVCTAQSPNCCFGLPICGQVFCAWACNLVPSDVDPVLKHQVVQPGRVPFDGIERSVAKSACPSRIYPATQSCLPLMLGMSRDGQQSAQPRIPARAPHPLRPAFAEPASAPPLLHRFVSSASPHRPPLFQRPELTDTERSIIEPRGHLPRPQNAARTGCWQPMHALMSAHGSACAHASINVWGEVIVYQLLTESAWVRLVRLLQEGACGVTP